DLRRVPLDQGHEEGVLVVPVVAHEAERLAEGVPGRPRVLAALARAPERDARLEERAADALVNVREDVDRRHGVLSSSDTMRPARSGRLYGSDISRSARRPELPGRHPR